MHRTSHKAALSSVLRAKYRFTVPSGRVSSTSWICRRLSSERWLERARGLGRLHNMAHNMQAIGRALGQHLDGERSDLDWVHKGDG